jgi:hypothetical protein
MIKDAVILGIGALFGLGATMVALAAPSHFPNTPAWVWYWTFWGGVTLMGLMLLDVALLFLWEGEGARLGPGLLLNLSLAGVAVAIIWHRAEPPAKKLPGFAAYAVVRIYDIPEFRRKYIFDFGAQASKARAAFYLSASDQFTFAVTDVRGETYPLEVKLGQGGIPIDRVIMLLCEAGVDEETTILRVSVNGKEIQRRKLSFPADFGDRNWGANSTLGANAIGQDNGIFMLAELVVWAETFSKDDAAKMLKNVTDFYKLKPD